MGQIQSTIMCNGTAAVLMWKKNCLQSKKDDEEVYVCVSVVSVNEFSKVLRVVCSKLYLKLEINKYHFLYSKP